MSKDALPENACQLESRYWRITNAKGDVEEVQGPGVVGKWKVTGESIYLMFSLLKFCLLGCGICIKTREKEVCPSGFAFKLFCKGYLNILPLNPSPFFYNTSNCWASIYASTGIQIDLP